MSADETFVLSDLGRLGEVEAQWRSLAESRGNPFVTPEWAAVWFNHYGDQATPVIVVLRGDAGVRGVLPLALSAEGRPRSCRFIGSNLGDVFHPVCPPEAEEEVAAASGSELAARTSEWTAIALEHAEVGRPWLNGLRRTAGHRLKEFPRGTAELATIDLARYGDWDAYLASRSSHLRKRLRQMERKLSEGGELRVRRTVSPAELVRDFATFFEVHDLRWAGRGSSSLGTDRSRAFLADFGAAALERGWLRLWFLELDGRAVATWYGWRLGERYAFYNAGFDPELSKLSPGLVLLAKVIESAFAEGAGGFDFLLGDESYKSRFADGARTVLDTTLAPGFPHPSGVAIGARQAAVRVARRIPPDVRRRLGLGRLSRRRQLRRR